MIMMKKIFLIFVLLILIGFISGCKTTPPTNGGEEATTTTVDTGLDDISGELNDVDTTGSEDYDLGDINIDEDMPPI